MTEAQMQRFIFRAGLLHRRGGHRRFRPRRRHGRGEDQHREDRRHHRSEERRRRPGTTFIIKIPLTLAIVSALIVEAGGERFAIPQISVVELVRAQKAAGPTTRPARRRDRADQRHAGAAPARPAAAAGQPATTCWHSASPSNDDTGAYIVVAQVGADSLRHHRRSGVRHRGDRGEAGGADPAPRHDVQRQHHPGRRLGDHDPGSQRHRARAPASAPAAMRKAKSSSATGCRSARPTSTAMLLFRAGGEQTHGGAARAGRPAGGHSARQDRNLLRRAGDAVPRQADAAGGAVAAIWTPRSRAQPVLVFNDGDRTMGLMVDEIVDVVEDRLDIELCRRAAGLARQRGDRRPGDRCDRHRLLADAGLAGLVPRRRAVGGR